MEISMENTHHSMSEHTPLLEHGSVPVTNDRLSPRSHFQRFSIFTRPVLCILFTELSERLACFSIGGNLALFAVAKNHLQMTPSDGSILVYAFQGTCFTVPIIAGWWADDRAGRFSAIFISSIVYLVGTILLPIGSITTGHEHSSWAANSLTTNTTFKRVFYIIGLFLVSFGTGGIKANVSPFGADQVSYQGPEAVQAFFSWFYWFINIGALFAFTFVVYIQQEYSYFYGNMFPAIFMLFAIIIFFAGKSSYQIRQPSGSVLTTTLKIVKEAIRKWRRPSLSASYVNHWLDRAKMCFGGSYSTWEVEDVKKIYRLLPIFATYIVYYTIFAQMNTSMLFQGKYMDINLVGDFQIPIASLSALDIIGVLVLIPIMYKIVYPLLARCNIRLSQLQRIGIGMIIQASSMAVAGGVEIYRQNNCCQNVVRGDDSFNVSSVTIAAQIPQYTLIGLSEVFTSVTGYELAYTEAPKTLQGLIMGVYLLTMGLGNYFGAFVVLVVNAITEAAGGKEKRWYPDEDHVNDGYYLAYYFFLLAGLMVLNTIVYIFLALSFKAKKEAAAVRNGDQAITSVDKNLPSA